MNDGTLVARRARLVLDNGAYSADAPFFPQMAIMHRQRPLPDRRTSTCDADLAYTNLQPSGSVRAPAAPQVCWAVEQHTDEVARALGIDPAEFRPQEPRRRGRRGPCRAGVRPRSACARAWSTRSS